MGAPARAAASSPPSHAVAPSGDRREPAASGPRAAHTAAAVTAIAASCQLVGGGTATTAPVAVLHRATARTPSSAPDPSSAAPRSSGGAHQSNAWPRQSGKARSSPSGAATRFEATPRSGIVGASSARSGAQPSVAASVVAMGASSLRAMAGPRTIASASGRCSTTRPIVAPAERPKETSQASSGSQAARIRSEQANERTAGALRSMARAAMLALSMAAARIAEPLPPAKSA